MRRNATPAIPPRMFRHFAIVTVIITAALAMFAEAEGRQAAVPAQRVAKPARPAALVIAAPTAASPQLPRWWDVEPASSDFERPAGRGNSSVIPDLDESPVPGYSPEYLAALSEEERELLLRGLQENGMLEPDIHERRTTALAAASARRSGAPSEGD